MAVLIRDEWIRLERAKGTIATMSGIMVVAGDEGQVTTDDGMYVWKKSAEVGEARPSIVEEGSRLLHFTPPGQWKNASLVRLLLLRNSGVCRESQVFLLCSND
jgi:hypothetical protein